MHTIFDSYLQINHKQLWYFGSDERRNPGWSISLLVGKLFLERPRIFQKKNSDKSQKPASGIGDSVIQILLGFDTST